MTSRQPIQRAYIVSERECVYVSALCVSESLLFCLLFMGYGLWVMGYGLWVMGYGGYVWLAIGDGLACGHDTAREII